MEMVRINYFVELDESDLDIHFSELVKPENVNAVLPYLERYCHVEEIFIVEIDEDELDDDILDDEDIPF